MRHVIILLTVCVLTACAAAHSDTAVVPKLETGITSSNGGGQRQLGNQPDVGVTTSTSPAK